MLRELGRVARHGRRCIGAQRRSRLALARFFSLRVRRRIISELLTIELCMKLLSGAP
jgi:hypothetical protein